MAMKFYLLLILYSTSCNFYNNNNITKFYEFFGTEKTEILKLTLASFDEFILKNYGHLESKQEQVKAFLLDLDESIEEIKSKGKKWIFDKDLNREIIKRYEDSGLLKEIYISKGELKDYYVKYDMKTLLPSDFVETVFPESEIDNNEIVPNYKGQFLYALYKFSTNKYAKKSLYLCYSIKYLTPGLVLNFAADESDLYDFSDPLIRFLIIKEVYIKIMQQNK